MKQLVCLGMILSLVLLGTTTAIAESSSIITFQCPDDFSLQSFDVNDDGSILLSGSVGRPMQSIPMMLLCNANGEVLWSEKDALDPGGIYHDVQFLTPDTVIALRSSASLEYTSVVECWKDGEVVGQTERFVGARRLYPISDGFLMDTVPNSLPGQLESRIIKMSMAGDELWRIEWDELLLFRGILTSDDLHVAFGGKTVREERTDHWPTSVIIAFDDQGQILWRHDNSLTETFIDAVWAEDDGVVLIGDTVGERGHWGFIAKYDASGEVWRRDYRYTGVESGVEESCWGDMYSITPTQDGYIVAVNVSLDSGMRFLFVDENGTVNIQWREEIGDWGKIGQSHLFTMSGKTYFIVNGKIEPTDFDESGVPKDFANLGLSQILCKVQSCG